MDLAISAVTSDLASRFISFLMNKCSHHVCSEEKVERLQQLLLRLHMVIEEADGRCITNSCMLIQLKTLAAAMYQGYHVLDTIRYKKHKQFSKEWVCNSSALSAISTPFNRSSIIGSTSSTNKFFYPELQSALQNLEALVANMAEFVMLLGGCERISRKPYDAYLYVDNFMFGRHVEKQQLINFLLQHNTSGPPAVLPVIGGHGVGKKTLVAHVCDHERVRSHFPFILHLNGDDILRISDHERLSGRTLVVVEFVSDVDDDDWTTFYSAVRSMDRGSKVIILARNEKLEKFGTVKPISLNCLAFEEYRYLFKILAFGSANPMDHPKLLQIVEEFPRLLGGSLVSANVLADAMRRNLNSHFWLYRLNSVRNTVKKNISCFGAHPQMLMDRGQPVHLMGRYVLSPAVPSRLAPSANVLKKDLPKIIFGDLLVAAGRHPVLLKGDFSLTSWESRLPPYTSFVHLVHFDPSCTDDKPETSLAGKKRSGLSM